MSRPLRLEFAHALYHVTSRGDRREDIYHDDADRQAWLNVLAQVCKRFNWSVQAYCMMDNPCLSGLLPKSSNEFPGEWIRPAA